MLKLLIRAALFSIASHAFVGTAGAMYVGNDPMNATDPTGEQCLGCDKNDFAWSDHARDSVDNNRDEATVLSGRINTAQTKGAALAFGTAAVVAAAPAVAAACTAACTAGAAVGGATEATRQAVSGEGINAGRIAVAAAAGGMTGGVTGAAVSSGLGVGVSPVVSAAVAGGSAGAVTGGLGQMANNAMAGAPIRDGVPGAMLQSGFGAAVGGPVGTSLGSNVGGELTGAAAGAAFGAAGNQAAQDERLRRGN